MYFLSIGIAGTYEPIERLKERQGKGMAEAKAIETPSKRTKKTDKAKLVRQVYILNRYSEGFSLKKQVIVLITKSFYISIILEFQSNWKADNRRRR